MYATDSREKADAPFKHTQEEIKMQKERTAMTF
jgi:hypothetical protein